MTATSTERSAGGALVLGALLLSAAVAAVQIRLTPPPSRGADAAATEFSAERARGLLRALVADGEPHPVGSSANAAVRRRLTGELERLGLEPDVQDAFACSGWGTCARVQNVVARLEGREKAPSILLMAHYDSVGAGPGASDDGAGTVAVLEIARALKAGSAPRRPVVFLLTDGEEAGLLGAQAFADEHPWAREVGAVVNLEARGSSGPSIMFETSGENAWLVELLASSVPRPVTASLFPAIYDRMPNDTDLSVFKRRQVPGVNFAYVGGVARYHTPLDSYDNADPRSLQHQGDNGLAMVRALAGSDLGKAPKGRAVFFDVLSAVVVRWPEPWTLPLALIAGVLVFGAAAGLARGGSLTARQLGFGLLAFFGALVLTAIVAGGFVRALRSSGAFPTPWVAHPAPAIAAFGLLAAACAAFFWAWLGPRAGAAGLWAGAWACWTLVAAALAPRLPAIGYLFLVPAFVAGIAGLPWTLRRASSARGNIAAVLAPAVGAALLLAPLMLLGYQTVGLPLMPLIAVLTCACAWGLAPLAAAPPERRWRVPVLLGGLSAAALLAALAVPPASPEAPQRLSIAFHQEAEDGRARWLARTDLRRLPGTFAEHIGFGHAPVAPFPWSFLDRAFVADADRIDADPPELTVIERSASRGERRLRVRVRSPRGAPVARLHFSPQAKVQSLKMNAKAAISAERPKSWYAGWQVFTCRTLPAEGIEVEVVLEGDGSAEVVLTDESPGLPPSGSRLREARPATAVPSHDGDLTIVSRKVRL